MKTKWTSIAVKWVLPRVTVELRGRILKGSVSGRKNKIATVWVKHDGRIHEASYSWAAVTRALNAGKALSVS